MKKITKMATAAALALLTLGVGQDDPVPWPRGEAPTSEQLDAKVGDAIELFQRERMEEYLEAHESGEDSEHIFVMQDWIDDGAKAGLVLDVARIFRFGDATFEHNFRSRDGLGHSHIVRPQRVHDGHIGGIDNYSCGGCHFQGGVNGAGPSSAIAFYFGDGKHISSAVVRTPPAVLGLGFVQALGVEMTADLARQRTAALAAAAEQGSPVAVDLVSKEVAFGSLTAHPDGTLDTRLVDGIDRDLVVKPFGWKGHTARLRRFAERALRIHFGIQSHPSVIENRDVRDPSMGTAPHWFDPDGDGKQRELEEGTLTALAVYLALLEAPVIIPPTDPSLKQRWARGSELFDRIGCEDCHRRSLPLSLRNWKEYSDTTHADPFEVGLSTDGEQPRGSKNRPQLFSDLKRHDMGPGLADSIDGPDGLGRSVFLTRPLWGLAESAPYLHDGRAVTIPEAIVAHGGEADAQRATFMALEPQQQADLHVFLLSLTREPRLRVAK